MAEPNSPPVCDDSADCRLLKRIIDGFIDDDDDRSAIETCSTPEILRLSQATHQFQTCEEFTFALEKTDNVLISDLSGRNAFMSLATVGCAPCLSKVYEKCPDCIDKQDYDGCTALMNAACNGHSECVDLLLRWLADVSLRDHNDAGVLHHSFNCDADAFSLETVRLLLQHNPDVNAPNTFGTTPLLQALESGKTSAVPLLLEFGADPTISDTHGSCPMVDAAWNGQLDALKAFLAHGVSINTRDGQGDTALLVASSMGHEDCVRYLLQNNADVSAINDDGCTALLLAQKGGHSGLQRLLHAAGCPPQRDPHADSSDLKLWDICCCYIRARLLDSNLHKNLICLIPQLNFPQRVKTSLLENVQV